MANRKKQIASQLTGAAYVWIGVMHFIDPLLFTPLVPELIGAPIFWVYLSGVAEVALGMGLCVNRIRPYASRIIILMLLQIEPNAIDNRTQTRTPRLVPYICILRCRTTEY